MSNTDAVLSSKLKNFHPFAGNHLTRDESVQLFGVNTVALRRVFELASKWGSDPAAKPVATLMSHSADDCQRVDRPDSYVTAENVHADK